MSNHTTISIDLAKTIFQVAIFSKSGKLQLNKKVNRKNMCKLISKYPNATIVMESCGTSHYWGRYFANRGHHVRLIPAQIAAKFRVGNKNDSNDAIAIYEASKHPNTHSVSVKTLEQQDIATLHRHREGLKKQTLQISNRIRGLALEYGVQLPLSTKKLCQHIFLILEDASNELTIIARQVIGRLAEELHEAVQRLEQATKAIESLAKTLVPCRLLQTLPGIGWLNASLLYSKLGFAEAFKRGRDASASLGIVPAHSGSGGRVMIGRITRRGDTYVRSMLINGARSVVTHAPKKTDGLSQWVQGLLKRKPFNTTVVAVANKLVRMAVAILKTRQAYTAPVAQSA